MKRRNEKSGANLMSDDKVKRLSNRFGIDASRIREIESKAIAKLQSFKPDEIAKIAKRVGYKRRKAIFVSITKAMNGEIDGMTKETEPKDMARGFWHVRDDKAEQAELLVAVNNGVIEGAWEIDRTKGWEPMKKGAIPHLIYKEIDTSRKFCCVKEVAPIEYSLVGEHISMLGIARMYGPVGYNF